MERIDAADNSVVRRMKRYVTATLAVIAIHLVLEMLWPPYFDFVVDCGGLFVHSNDIADIPRNALLGNVMIGGLAAAVINGVVALYANT